MQGYQLTTPNTSQAVKAKAIYLFLVEVNQITPLPADKTDSKNIKKWLALWIHAALPDGDPLKQRKIYYEELKFKLTGQTPV